MRGRDSWLRCAVVAGLLALLALAAPAAQALTPATFSYTGPPVPIPDGLGADTAGPPATVTIPVAGLDPNVADVDFRIDGTTCSAAIGSTTVGIDHTFVSDLQISLTSPGGTTRLLINRTDSLGNNFCQTLLDDESAGANIQTATAASQPFTGSWQPNVALSAFDGEDPNGDWVVTVQDFVNNDTGNIRAVSIIVTPKATPAIAGTSSADVTLGGSVSETAVVTGRDTPIADAVDFNLYGPGDATCANPPVFTTAAAAIDVGGNASSASFAPTAIGTYTWQADYSGDGNNVAATSGCGGSGQTVVVAAPPPPPPAKAVTAITGTSSPNTAQGGVAMSPAFRVTAPGAYRWIAAYSGDASNAPSPTPCGQGAQAVSVRAPVVCASQRQVTVRLIRRKALLRDLRGARIVAATLTPAAGGAAVKQRFTKTVATIDLRGLPKGRYTVRVRIRQRSGKTFTFTRTYQTCEFPRSVSVGGT